MNSRYKGIFFITLSALSFAFMNAFVRLSGDLPSVQKSFFRNLVAFFIALIMIIRSKDGFKIEKGNLKYMILRATFGTVGILCNFYAVDHLVLSDASMLNKMSPFFVIIFSFLLLKEKMSPAQALAVAGAFIGSLFVIKPTFTNMALVPSLIGSTSFMIVPSGAIAIGVAYLMFRKKNMQSPEQTKADPDRANTGVSSSRKRAVGEPGFTKTRSKTLSAPICERT